MGRCFALWCFRRKREGSVTQRLLALVTIYDGGAWADMARLAGVCNSASLALVISTSAGQPMVINPEAMRRAGVATRVALGRAR
jgi:hypothetical protein